MKKIACVFLACLSLFGIQAGAKKAVGPAEIKVISYNIRNGEANDGTNSWQYRYPTSAMMIMDQMPDIFGLQEAYDYQVRYLDEYTEGYKSVGVGRDDGKKKGEHMSIFYNKKTISLLKWGTFWLSETPDKPSKGWDAACYRTATWALLKDKRSGKKFWYVNTHLDHVGKEARKNGLSLIVNKIKEINPKGYPMVLTGDFNVTPDDPCLVDLNKIMKSARNVAVKTDKGYTFNNWGKITEGQPIDYIYYSGFSSCPVFEVIRKPYAGRKFISDHFPVSAILVF